MKRTSRARKIVERRARLLRNLGTEATVDTGAINKSGTTWRDTVLWQELTKCDLPDAHEVAVVLEGWLPEIENVLHHGGTSPPDFTLHDEGHAFRVASECLKSFRMTRFGLLALMN
jgi:hypothetical protein